MLITTFVLLLQATLPASQPTTEADLRRIIANLQRQIVDLKKQVEGLTKENESLRAKVPAPAPANATKFSRIKNGMSKAAVMSLLGNATELETADNDGNEIIRWVHTQEDGQIIVYFRDGIVTRAIQNR